MTNNSNTVYDTQYDNTTFAHHENAYSQHYVHC